MAVALHEVGRHGKLDLTIGTRDGRTVVQRCYCEVPFKITRLHDSLQHGAPHLIVMQCTPGLFGGDVVESAIRVERGARVLITQQSATKVHPSRGLPAVQRTTIHVAPDAELHLSCEALIPFEDSCLEQTTSINVAAGGRVYYWEGIMAGRISKGEAWKFQEVSSQTSLRIDGELLYLDRYRLRPRTLSPDDRWMMGEHLYMGLGLCWDQSAPDVPAKLHELLPKAGVDEPAPGLTVVRALARTGCDFHRDRAAFDAFVGSLKPVE